MAKPNRVGLQSKRARLLKWVLDCINAEEYESFGSHMVFGGVFEDILEDLTERDADKEALRELTSDLRTHRGRILASRRTSLDKEPSLDPRTLRGLGKLSPEALQAIEELFKTKVQRAPALVGAEGDDFDALDAKYAAEVLGKLEKIISRVSVLGPLKMEEVRDAALRAYFAEAHACILYGFRVACAVLCRAILESALKTTLDPKGRIEIRLTKGQSYFDALVGEAVKRSILTDDRPGCAVRVKKAGGFAIHDLKRFEKDYPGNKLEEILLDTRKILVDLLGPAPHRKAL